MMKTDELKKLVEAADAALDIAREVIALREAAKEVHETHMLTAGGSPEAWAKHCAALATLRAVLGESE
jgi:predicted ATP-grasp superfamily ATP-dependent carboligase